MQSSHGSSFAMGQVMLHTKLSAPRALLLQHWRHFHTHSGEKVGKNLSGPQPPFQNHRHIAPNTQTAPGSALIGIMASKPMLMIGHWALLALGRSPQGSLLKIDQTPWPTVSSPASKNGGHQPDVPSHHVPVGTAGRWYPNCWDFPWLINVKYTSDALCSSSWSWRLSEGICWKWVLCTDWLNG